MKRCQNCNFRNEGLLDYCWECGAHSIVSENSGFLPQSAQATQAFNSFQSETPTAFVNQGFNQNYNTNGYNYSTNNYQTPPSSGSRKIFLGVAALFTFLLLFTAVGAATYYKMNFGVETDNFGPREVKQEVVVEKEETVKREETETTVSRNNSTNRTNSTNNVRTTNNSSNKTTTTTKKSNTVRNNGRETAEFKRMWVDYNVKENGRLGMRIHVSFKTINMKGMPSYLAIYFEKRDGTPIKTRNKNFASTDGQLALYKFLTPGYSPAVYDDVVLFLPYDEITLGRGKFNLTMAVDVIYEKGGRIKHLKDYDFIYEER
jgi:hypothetical protein